VPTPTRQNLFNASFSCYQSAPATSMVHVNVTICYGHGSTSANYHPPKTSLMLLRTLLVSASFAFFFNYQSLPKSSSDTKAQRSTIAHFRRYFHHIKGSPSAMEAQAPNVTPTSTTANYYTSYKCFRHVNGSRQLHHLPWPREPTTIYHPLLHTLLVVASFAFLFNVSTTSPHINHLTQIIF
jgi:hypothetical protein